MPDPASPPRPPSRALILHPLHPLVPRPPPTLPAAKFTDVPLDILRLVAAQLAASGTARDLCAFEGVCTATR